MTRKTKTSSSADRATQYALDVVAGRIIAGPHVRNACRRHLDDLQHGHERGLFYDEAAADRAIRFYEQRLQLSEGQFEGKPFLLHPSQAFKTGSIFGWKRADGTRRFRRVYIEEGKGNGKSPWVAGLGLYGMTADGEAGAEIYAAAAKKDQAQVMFRDAVKMVKKSPRLKQRLKMSGGEGKEHNIAYLAKSSFFRPISREAGTTGSGPRPHMALCDEIHEMPSRTIIEMLEAGFKFRRQPMLAMITNSGTDRKTICWEEHERAIRVAAGTKTPGADFAYVGDIIDKNADAQFSFVCALDPGDDPLKDPTCWAKANPLLGVTITEDYLADEVAKAVAMPGKLNATLRLNFCVWTDAETAWMTREALEPCLAEFDPADHHGKRTGIGIDLSQSRDITAKANIVQTGTIDVQVRVESEDGSVETKIVEKPTYDAWIEAWTPGDTINERSVRDDTPYDLWAREGHLNAPKGQSIRFDHVAQALADDDRNFEIGLVAYDRYAFRRFEDEVHSIGLDIPFVEHPQAGVKKGKPTQSMIDAAKARDVDPEGLWMPGSLLMLEECILERRIRLKINPVLISAMMSAVTDNDRYGNHWLAKERAVNKIDAVIALCMAIGAIAADPGESTGVAALLESLR